MRDVDKTKEQLLDELAGLRRRVVELEDADAERTQTEQERERLIVELDAFAHTVAHDLKAPLGIVIGMSELLRQSTDIAFGDMHLEVLRSIIWNAYKMDTIIDELLVLAGVRRLEEVPMAPLDMEQIAVEAQQRLIYMIEEYRAEIVLLPADAWPAALGYAPWVEEVWANYISNAIKYGGQPPRVELGAAPHPGGMVIFWVRDNGGGIAPEDRKRLFAPFTRLDRMRARGHGLGLSIVQRIVERLGGKVGVESTPGQGSKFSFTLPAAPTD
ncbi:MAG: hypothetical protein JXB47_11410 [Anaerolineae bacterium]|nr:hypothetical protein [Anaerolineae bacterium]